MQNDQKSNQESPYRSSQVGLLFQKHRALTDLPLGYLDMIEYATGIQIWVVLEHRWGDESQDSHDQTLGSEGITLDLGDRLPEGFDNICSSFRSGEKCTIDVGPHDVGLAGGGPRTQIHWHQSCQNC
ncbi:hypothetical protein BSKO_01687 [Bryopsis sp. KO-2023]|nr:hypothetical protein BSKO_01687 [Bryopsis sp. KO-2023]